MDHHQYPLVEWFFGVSDSCFGLDCRRGWACVSITGEQCPSTVPELGTQLLGGALEIFAMGTRDRIRLSTHNARILLAAGGSPFRERSRGTQGDVPSHFSG